MQDRVVQLARALERPEASALPCHVLDGRGRANLRCADRDGRDALRGIDIQTDIWVVHAVGAELALQRRQLHSFASATPGGLRSDLARYLLDAIFELGRRDELIDQPPLNGPLSFHALLNRAEEISVIPPYHPLVHNTGETAGSRQDCKQRHFGQRHRGRAVVDHDDTIGRERELVAAAGGSAVDDRHETLAGVLARILHGIARFVRELAEVDLMRVLGSGEHADVRTGAEYAVLGRAQQDDLDVRMLEPQPRQRIGKLDVDAEIIGIQLELVAFE